MWGRLGYPRRAMRLHACAVAIVERHGGEVPDRPRPAAGAAGRRHVHRRGRSPTFAYGQRHPVVDTNVRRVVSRAVEGKPDAGPTTTAADLAPRGRLLPGGRRAGGPGQHRVHGARRGGLHRPRPALPAVPVRGRLRLAAQRRARRSPARAANPSGTRAPTVRCAACCSRCSATRPARCPGSAWTWSGPTTCSAPGRWPGWSRTAWCEPLRSGEFALAGDAPSGDAQPL